MYPTMFTQLSVALCVSWCAALDNGVGQTPAMGWNSWNIFKDKLSEEVVKTTADLLVSTGLAAKGYKYVNMVCACVLLA
jgi:alpha-galactosidase